MIYQEKELTPEILESLDLQAYEVKRYGQIMRCSTGWIKEFGLDSPTTILLPFNPPSKEEIKRKAHEYLVDAGCLSSTQTYTAFQIERMLAKCYTQALIDIGFKKEEIK